MLYWDMANCGDDSNEMNGLINSKMETKKLRLRQDKCFKIHIYAITDLKSAWKKRENVSQASYLEDILSEKGTIDETIKERNQKATGIISQISSMLSLGSFHFEIAMVLREAKFTNSILTNAEVWRTLQSMHTDSLEKYDLTLLRNI